MPSLFSDDNESLPVPLTKLFNKLQLEPDSDVNDFMFLCIVYNILECGFVLCHEKLTEIKTYDFDIKSLEATGNLELSDIYTIQDGKFVTKLRFGNQDKCEEMLLIGHPSESKQDPHLLVHLRSCVKEELASICIFPENYYRPKSEYFFRLRSELSLNIKDNLAWPLKSSWLQRNVRHCYPHYVGLPHPAVRCIQRFKKTVHPYSSPIWNKN